MTSLVPVVSAAQTATVARLARAIWQAHYVPIIGQAQVDYMLARFQSEAAITRQLAEGCEYFLARSDGEDAGYVAVVPNLADGTLLLSKIYVAESFRGCGAGKAILAFVERLCRRRGIGTIRLTVNKHNAQSIAWYTRMGFANAGPTVQDIGGGFIMNDYRMEKMLAG